VSLNWRRIGAVDPPPSALHELLAIISSSAALVLFGETEMRALTLRL